MDGIPATVGSPATNNLTTDALQSDTIAEESHNTQPAATPMADGPPPRKKTRHRILHKLSHTSSSSSLPGSRSGRARSSSTPDSRSGPSLSCVSLSASSSPFASSSSSSNAGLADPNTPPGSAGSASQSTSLQLVSSPTTPFPPYPHVVTRSQSSNAIRRVDLANLPGAGSSGGTSALPTDMVRAASMPLYAPPRRPKTFAEQWYPLPREVELRILGFLKHKELVRLSRTNHYFHRLCFDGQLWTTLDASEFYNIIPGPSLAKILTRAGPFVKNLNLRGCSQMALLETATLLAECCTNVVNATLEGCQIDSIRLKQLLQRNTRMAHLNVCGLNSVHNRMCLTIASNCLQLESLNLSWCQNVTAGAACAILEACPKLRDLCLGEVPGFHDPAIARRFFNANRLERLVLRGCRELNDSSLTIMMHGVNPQRDLLTGIPLTPPRALKHLDVSRCTQISDIGIKAVGQCAPHLEGLIVHQLALLTNKGLGCVLASAPNLSLLEADDVPGLTDELLIVHIARSPCAETHLKHLSLSGCDNITDNGVLPVLRACKNLASFSLDNTAITNKTLVVAAEVVQSRPPIMGSDGFPCPPVVGLQMEVYDCPGITWPGLRAVLSRNTEVLTPPAERYMRQSNQIIFLKSVYSYQMTHNEHTKRVLQGRLGAARRLEHKWVEFLQATDEALVDGAGSRRRRRRMRAAAQAHYQEEQGLGGTNTAQSTGVRSRARTATCAIM